MNWVKKGLKFYPFPIVSVSIDVPMHESIIIGLELKCAGDQVLIRVLKGGMLEQYSHLMRISMVLVM